jgi:Zn-dependent protease
VILFEPQHTQFDLHFRIFRIPVRVHPMFWLFSALLGWDFFRMSLGYGLLWVACTFISILLHELGHVFMAQAFGSRSHIVLYTFGGLAIRDRIEPYRWQCIAVSFAGPLAGFVLYGIIWLVREFGVPRWDPWHEMFALRIALEMLLFMNLFWNALNLLPIWPLDGGKISREVFTGLSPGRGLRLSLGASFLLAAVLAINALMAAHDRPLIPFLDFLEGTYLAIFFALLALESFQLLQQTQAPPGRWHYPDEW